MTQQVLTLTVKGKPQAVPFNLNPEEKLRPALQAEAEAFAARVNIDQLLQNVVTEVIDDAYSQSNDEPQPSEYAQMLDNLSVSHLDFYDDDVVLFLLLDGTPCMTFSCQIYYTTPEEIEDLTWNNE